MHSQLEQGQSAAVVAIWRGAYGVCAGSLCSAREVAVPSQGDWAAPHNPPQPTTTQRGAWPGFFVVKAPMAAFRMFAARAKGQCHAGLVCQEVADSGSAHGRGFPGASPYPACTKKGPTEQEFHKNGTRNPILCV